ncbi:MAG: WD40 repeat domain-containing protein [Planctomycetales bacterium]|nr:WD40 repeat domain-containing protein [Planctomycetales bacterium]
MNCWPSSQLGVRGCIPAFLFLSQYITSLSRQPIAHALYLKVSIMAADPAQSHVAHTIKHASPLINCRFDPTGKFVFASAQDSRVWRWNVEGEPVAKEFAGHESWTNGMAFTSDGATLVTSGYDGRLVWWPAQDDEPKPVRTVEAHSGWVRSVAVSPDNQLLVSGGNDRLVKLWNMADGSLVREFAGHESHVYSVAFHPDGQRLLSCDHQMNLFEWNVAGGEPTRKFQAADLQKYDKTFHAIIGGARDMAIDAEGKHVAVSGITNVSNAFAGVGNPAIEVFSLETGESVVKHLAKEDVKGCGWGVAFHPEQFTIGLSGGGGGGLLFLWKPGEKDEFHKFKLPNTARGMSLAPDQLTIATAHADGNLRLTKMAAKAA